MVEISDWMTNMDRIIRKSKLVKESTLKDSEQRYRRLFEAAQDGILILDANTGSITDVNPFLEKLLGYSKKEFISKKLWEVGAFKDIKASKNAFLALQKNEYIRYKDLPLRAKDGNLIQVEFVSNVYMEGHSKVIQCNIRDITERKQAQDALIKKEVILKELSVRDPLTNLFNRRYLEETLERELAHAKRKKYSLGVMMIDVDDFKKYNDFYGHAAGDMVLRELGQLFFRNIREEDIVCRYGGDEIIVVLPETTPQVTTERAELFIELAKNLQVHFNKVILPNISLSIGISFYPENGSTKAQIINTADLALFEAKNNGRGQVVTCISRTINEMF